MKELIGFEIKKITGQRLVIYSVLILLCVNIFNIVQNNHQYLWGRDVTYNKASLAVYEKVNGRLDSEKVNWLSENAEKLSFLISANLKIPDEYKNWGCTYFELSQIFTYHLSEIERIYTYNSSVKDMLKENEKHMETAREFGNSYMIKTDEKVDSTYKERAVNVYHDTDRFSAYLDYGFSSFLILLIVLLAISSIFSGENESGMLNLFYTTKNGRIQLAIAKIITLLLFVGVICIIFSITDLLTFKFAMKLEGYSAPLYSMTSYEKTPLQISIGLFVIMTEFVKMIGFMFVGLAVCFLSSILKKSFVVFSVGLASSLGLMFLSAYSNMFLDYINLFNPINLITSSVMYKKFGCIDIFGNPVFNSTLTLVCCLFAMVSLCVLIIAVNNKNSRKSKMKGAVTYAGFKS